MISKRRQNKRAEAKVTLTDQHSRYEVWTIPKWCQQRHISFHCALWQHGAISPYIFTTASAVICRRVIFYLLSHFSVVNKVSHYAKQDAVTCFDDTTTCFSDGSNVCIRIYWFSSFFKTYCTIFIHFGFFLETNSLIKLAVDQIFI